MAADKPKPIPWRIALVVNEFARGGDHRAALTEELYRQIQLFQDSTGQKVALTLTRTPEHIARAIPKLQKEGCNLFISGGGDGTLNDILQQLQPGNILLPLPLGNANDFARRLNITHWRDTVQIVKNIIAGRINLMGLDVGEVQFRGEDGQTLTRRFINNLGVGVTADTVKRVEGQVHKTYVLSGLVSLLQAKPFDVTFYSSQYHRNIRSKILGMECLLSRQVGRFAQFAPFKHQNDERLHFILFRNKGLLDRLRLMILLHFGRRLVTSGLVDYFHDKTGEPGVTNRQGILLEEVNSVWGMFHQPQRLHVDGNLVPEFHARLQPDCKIRLLPKLLRTCTPC